VFHEIELSLNLVSSETHDSLDQLHVSHVVDFGSLELNLIVVVVEDEQNDPKGSEGQQLHHSFLVDYSIGNDKEEGDCSLSVFDCEDLVDSIQHVH